MSHYVTTHNANGEAIFTSKIPTEHVHVPTPFGSMNILSTTHNTPLNVSTEADIDQYAQDRTEGLGQRICPNNGTATAFVNMKPNASSPLHRTMTHDVVVVIEGELEFHLDSGEKIVMKAGDSVVQRAGMHRWVNVTPSDGWARMLAFAQPVVEPVEVGAKKLVTDFRLPEGLETYRAPVR
ncbi:hypothetical protein LTR37_017634 [Vermiconidia calcicola]|uniref:Uncharacterized protein n=1 Tax=Vermiconidia calcicola TaxID=1690605 RepID=A0ACC3MJL4_9PEZI|nr:hypothetical protein LTR37_017634 [Vermiconidia calcicola]